jgi:glycosyltransferase involved in cell wall biosynthesis
MQQELVSIITPMYNAVRFVGQTIESVLAQTYPHFEMLIVDDGSRDNSHAIAAAYAKNDSRIKVLRQDNAGSAAARNNALSKA